MRLPPLGYSTFYLQPDGDGCTRDKGSAASSPNTQRSPSAAAAGGGSGSEVAGKGGKHEKIDNGLVSLEFDTETGVWGLGQAGRQWAINRCCC